MEVLPYLSTFFKRLNSMMQCFGSFTKCSVRTDQDTPPLTSRYGSIPYDNLSMVCIVLYTLDERKGKGVGSGTVCVFS
jgi:hypothetical protein